MRMHKDLGLTTSMHNIDEWIVRLHWDTLKFSVEAKLRAQPTWQIRKRAELWMRAGWHLSYEPECLQIEAKSSSCSGRQSKFVKISIRQLEKLKNTGYVIGPGKTFFLWFGQFVWAADEKKKTSVTWMFKSPSLCLVGLLWRISVVLVLDSNIIDPRFFNKVSSGSSQVWHFKIPYLRRLIRLLFFQKVGGAGTNYPMVPEVFQINPRKNRVPKRTPGTRVRFSPFKLRLT